MATTEERTPDMAALEELYAWAESEAKKQAAGLPNEWDQGQWGRIDRQSGCATACCIAGRQALLDGGIFVHASSPWMRVTGMVNEARMPGGRVVEIRDYAADRLGLHEEQADALFGSENELADLRRIIDLIGTGETFPYGYDPEDY